MIIKIENEEDYKVAMYWVDKFFNCEPNCPESDLLEVFSAAVEAYEDIHYPIGKPTLEGYLEFCLDQSMEPDPDVIKDIENGLPNVDEVNIGVQDNDGC